MKQEQVKYTIGDPPKALKHAQMDNIALVPASLLLKTFGVSYAKQATSQSNRRRPMEPDAESC